MTSDHIKIGDVTPWVQYVGDGSQTQFDFLFPIFENEDLEVYLGPAGTPEAAGYAVGGAGESAGGSVTFDTAPGNGVTVTLLRNVVIRRTTDFTESGDFRASVINTELDRLTAVAQQLSNRVGRAVRLADTDGSGAVQLPPAAQRAGKLAAFDASGNLVAAALAPSDMLVSPFMETLLDDADGAAARDTLGAQAQADDLDTIAALTPDDGDVLTYDGGAWTAAVPATAIEQTSGTWTPVLTFATPGDLSVTYSSQSGTYLKSGDLVFATFSIVTTSFVHSTSSGICLIDGLPAVSADISGNESFGALAWSGINKPSHTQIVSRIGPNSAQLSLRMSGMNQYLNTVAVADLPTGANVVLLGAALYRAGS